MGKSENLRKVKFYDWSLWITLFSFLLMFGAFVSNTPEIFSQVFISIGFLSLAVFWIGILYNMAKKKYWGWFWITLLLIPLFGAGIIFILIVYFNKMREVIKNSK